MDELEFAQRLKRYRRERGLTQQELADRIGVSNKSVSRWESGSYPDVPTLLSLARALDVTVDALLDPGAPVPTLQKSDWQNLLSRDRNLFPEVENQVSGRRGHIGCVPCKML